MRIRTVKPDFWTHPFWAKQSDAVRLLALALLNYADDSGFFYADPELVREVMPYWDSTKIRRTLGELSTNGWVEYQQGPEGYGLIGRIVQFGAHQRIDKPKESKIKKLWRIQDSSKINPRLIQDQSTREVEVDQGSGKDASARIGDSAAQSLLHDAKSKAPDGRAATVIGIWCGLWNYTRKLPYHPLPKDKGLSKRLDEMYPDKARLKEKMLRYLEDVTIANRGWKYSFAHFFETQNSYGEIPRKADDEPRLNADGEPI